MCLVSGGRSADITAGADVWFRAARAAALIGDLGHHNAGRGIDQQQAVVDDRVSVYDLTAGTVVTTDCGIGASA
jgi:hypothetical protein